MIYKPWVFIQCMGIDEQIRVLQAKARKLKKRNKKEYVKSLEKDLDVITDPKEATQVMKEIKDLSK